jgi:hypothetical protein
MTTPIDSIPRVSVQDLVIALRLFEGTAETTLENLRLRFCYARNKRTKGHYLFATAVIVAGEMQKLGLIEAGALPAASSKAHETSKKKAIKVTERGQELLRLFQTDRGAAYDRLFALMYAAHRNLQTFVGVILERNLFAPLATSVKDHVGASYATGSALADAVAEGTFNVEEPLRLLTQRLGRALTDDERTEIKTGVETLVRDSQMSATTEEGTEFAKNFLGKLNDVVIPALFRTDGLPFDYRTHRTIWSLGEEFKLWGTITSHPDYNGTVVYRTASIILSPDKEQVQELVFDSGLKKTGENFLGKLFAAYQKLQAQRKTKLVSAWELRSIFCLDNRCQQSVFNSLFERDYAGSDTYNLHFEIQQVKSRHEKPLRAGQRSVGTILMTKEQQ